MRMEGNLSVDRARGGVSESCRTSRLHLPIDAAWAADGRKFSLHHTAFVPSDTSRPCSKPPAAEIVHFAELLTRLVTPDVTWTSRVWGHKGGPSAAQATGERHQGCFQRCVVLILAQLGGRSDC